MKWRGRGGEPGETPERPSGGRREAAAEGSADRSPERAPERPLERPGDARGRTEPARPKKRSRTKRWLFFLFVVVAAFACGFGWQYVRAESLEEQLVQARSELVFAELEATLAAAAFQVYRGAYEQARQLASDFFTGLQTHVNDAPVGVRTELQSILAERDRLITLLSRAEPDSREALAQLYSRYRAVIAGGSAAPAAAPEAGTGDTAPAGTG